MKQIISLFARNVNSVANTEIEDDFTELFKAAVKSGKKVTKREKNIEVKCNIKDRFCAKINSFLLEEKLINPELFRCAVYISNVVAFTALNVPKSYYASEYYIKGHDNKDASLFLQG